MSRLDQTKPARNQVDRRIFPVSCLSFTNASVSGSRQTPPRPKGELRRRDKMPISSAQGLRTGWSITPRTLIASDFLLLQIATRPLLPQQPAIIRADSNWMKCWKPFSWSSTLPNIFFSKKKNSNNNYFSNYAGAGLSWTGVRKTKLLPGKLSAPDENSEAATKSTCK